MKVGITGASGFIGKYLIRRLRARGHKTITFTREGGGRPASGMATRPFAADRLPDLRGLDAVINLAGESILGWWTKGKKQRVMESRLRTTGQLVEAMEELPAGKRPKILVNASAIGFYGDRGEEMLDENQPAGTGFLADVARQWEDAAHAAEPTGARVACVRIGLVLGADGGAFPMQHRLFGAGLGGRLGSGKQWMSPVHVEDVAGLFVFLMERDAAAGAFNAVCPEPVRNEDYTHAVGKALHRPTVLPAPAFALRTLLGDASHLLLDSARVVPTRTLAAGYTFRFPTLESILADVCQSTGSVAAPQIER